MGSPIAGYGGSVAISSTPNVALTNEVLTDSGNHTAFNISSGSFATKRYWDPTAAFVIQTEVDDIQTVSITGGPTGGTWTLTFGGDTTVAIAYNAAASAVQSALVALASIGSGNVSVTGSAGGPYTVEFIGSLGYAAQTLMTASGAGLTGGSSPGVNVVHTQTGTGWTTASASSYTIRYVTGQVVFTSALAGTPGCRVSSGAYLPFSTFSNMKQWEATPTLDLYDSTTFGSPWKSYTAGLLGADLKLDQFYTDTTFIAQITAGTTFIVSCLTGRNATERFEGFAHLKSDDIKVPVNALEEESLTYTVNGQLYYFAGQYS